MRNSSSSGALILFALSCLVPSAALAQNQGAAIAGMVKDATGAALPGVRVETSSPALIEGTRVVMTDRQGAYRIVDLRPGVYTVTFVRDGFTSVTWQRVELTAAFTAIVNVVMQAGNSEQTSMVSGEIPSVDSQNVSHKAVTSRQLMDALPSDRTYVSFAAMTPGMQIIGGLHNVGGSQPETAQMLRIHGSRINESRLFVDGMSVMSGNSTGGLALGNFLNNAMAHEVIVNTGSMSAEFELGGVASNIVTKEGSNTFHGSFTGRFTNSALQSSNLSADLVARDLSSGSRIQKIWDANPSIGGPLVKDRMWLFSSVRHWGTYNYVAGLYNDLDRTALFYAPDLTKPAVYPVQHFSGDARLTYRATRRNKVGAYYHHQRSDFGTCTSPAPTRQTAPSACAHYKNDPQWFAQATWSSPLTRTALIETGATVTFQNATGRRDPGVPTDLSAITEERTNFTWRAPAGGFGGTRNSQSNYRVAVSYVTGRHSVKVGLTLQRQWRVTGTDHNNGVNYTFRTQTAGILTSAAPTGLTQFAEPTRFSERVNYNLGLYAQDQWAVSRLTFNLGVRVDFLNTQVDAQKLPAGPLIPARDFAAVKNVPNWRDLSPRLGAAYDPFGNGKTAIKATLGRYVVGESYTIARAVNPLESTKSSARRTWDDRTYPIGDPRRGNFTPDCDLTSVAANGECGPTDPNTFGQLVVTTRYDSEVTEGFGVRPYNWVASLSVEHELVRRISVSAGYFRRWYGNFNNITQNLAVTNADFSTYCITAPKNQLLPGGGGNEICGFYDVSVEKYGQTNEIITSAEHFGRQEDVFDGFDFTINARLPNRVLLGGGLSLGRQRTNNCYVIDDRSLSFPATSPRTTPFCKIDPPMQPNMKVQGVYPLPWWGVQVAATFQSLPGPPLSAQLSVTNDQIRSSLGRNLASCGVAETCSASVSLDLLPPGTLFGDRVNQVDIRLSKTWKAGRMTVRPTMSVYNLFNANPVLQYVNRYTTSWPAPTAILTARFVDFGVQIDF